MKCSKCEIEFVPKEWNYKSRDYRCPACKRKQQNAYNRNDPNFLEKSRRTYQLRKQWYKEYYQKLKLDAIYVAKKRARRALQYAIETGKIVRPEYCDICHKRGRIDAHHTNYKEPLNVEWKCRSCHIGERRNS